MSFGKPKNPLIESDNPAHENFHIDKIEARMLDTNAMPIKCGCVTMRTIRGRILRRCAHHQQYVEPMPDEKKSEE